VNPVKLCRPELCSRVIVFDLAHDLTFNLTPLGQVGTEIGCVKHPNLSDGGVEEHWHRLKYQTKSLYHDDSGEFLGSVHWQLGGGEQEVALGLRQG